MVFPSLQDNYYKIITSFTDADKYSYLLRITDVSNLEEFRLPDFHPNISGQQKIAEDIYQFLDEAILSDCQSIN